MTDQDKDPVHQHEGLRTSHAHTQHTRHTSLTRRTRGPNEDEIRATCVLRTMHAPWSLAQHWLRAATLQPILSEFYCRKAPWHKGPQYPCQMRVIKSQFRKRKKQGFILGPPCFLSVHA